MSAPHETRTVCLTLGHDGLTLPVSAARSAIRSTLATHDAFLLAEFENGRSTWNTPGGETIYETSDAWLAILPVSNIAHVRANLAHLARKFGQDAIGLTIHDHETYGESYVSAE